MSPAARFVEALLKGLAIFFGVLALAAVCIAVAVWASGKAHAQDAASTSIFDQTFTTAPHLNVVTVAVEWSTRAQIAERCGPGAGACATIGRHNYDLVYIWAQLPRSFSDDRLCDLGYVFLRSMRVVVARNDSATCNAGHELGHNLGGEHRQ